MFTMFPNMNQNMMNQNMMNQNMNQNMFDMNQNMNQNMFNMNQNNNMFQNMNLNNNMFNMNQNNMFQNNMNQFNMNQNNPFQMNMNMNQNNMFQQNFNNGMNFPNMNMMMLQQQMFQQMMMNNMMNNNNNVNQNNNNTVVSNNNNNNNKDQPKENLPRGEKVMSFVDDSDGGSKININLHASSGLKVMMSVSENITFQKLFRLYAEKIGIGQNLLGKDIIFLFNAETIKVDDTSLIKNKISNLATITVVDQNNVIGAKKTFK